MCRLPLGYWQKGIIAKPGWHAYAKENITSKGPIFSRYRRMNQIGEILARTRMLTSPSLPFTVGLHIEEAKAARLLLILLAAVF
jgi:hypothetical protein